MRAFWLGTPGEMRDQLNALVVAGEKVATAGLWEHDYVSEDEPLDEVGERQALLASDDSHLLTVEVTRVEVHRFADVPLEFVLAEGEWARTVEDWQSGHAAFWREAESWDVDDDSQVVCVWFRVTDEPGS